MPTREKESRKQQKKKKKPNKEQREKRKAERAEVYGKGFEHGYVMGYEQAKRDLTLEINDDGMQTRYSWF